MQRINPNIPPPNGFKFRNTDGALITSYSWPTLIRKVIAYRRQIGGNVDTVEQEIEDQVCKAAPGFCEHGTDGVREEIAMRQNLKARVLAWLADQARKGPLKKVCDNTARIRARACVGCPNRQMLDMGCSSCQRNTFKLRKACLDGADSVNAGLGGCSVTGEDLGVAIHLWHDPLPAEGLPDFCWRKNNP